MLIKCLFYLFVLVAVSFVSRYSSVRNDETADGICDQQDDVGSATRASYSSKIKGWLFCVSFEKCTMAKDGVLILTNVSGSLSKPNKTIRLQAGKCSVFVSKKIAHLNDGVSVQSNDIDAETADVIVDWEMGTISGHSRITGRRKGSKFYAKGFSINEDGEVSLKGAKVVDELGVSGKNGRKQPRKFRAGNENIKVVMH
jgi:hypothetical protein